MIVLAELVHAVAWLPVLMIVSIGFFLAHLTIPALAEAERWAARRLGASAPSGREDGESVTRWCSSRIVTAAFWRQDLPLAAASLVLGLASMFVTVIGGVLVVIAAGVPWIVSEEHPVGFGVGTATRPIDAWWAIPASLLLAAICLAVLAGIGRLRLVVTEILGRDAVAERAKELDAQVGDLTRGRATLVDAFEAERSRIERDLHDGTQQELVALAMNLGGLRLAAESLPEDDAASTSRTALLEGIDTAQDRAESALKDLRETVRGIRPAVLSERGLAPALKDLAGRAPLPTSVVVEAEKADLALISQPVRTVVYFAVAEALTNTSKHARASRATVALRCTSAGLSTVITDDGRGGADPERENATGLRGIAQRVESIGGRLEVSSPEGAGTQVTITAPLTPPWGTENSQDGRTDEPQDDHPAG